ncbi:hypothetical protein BC941DRAFT_433019 [Chlamydoabsidia padenii]|nr:hypothetical protein BC941DRAFT_433019 [Chlamydoabsidia padenii]
MSLLKTFTACITRSATIGFRRPVVVTSRRLNNVGLWTNRYHGQQQQGSFHTSPITRITYQHSDLTDDTYHRISDKTFNQMVDVLEAIGDETELEGFDLEYSQGVMTLKLGEHGTYVINKQPPNKQIWLSSPKSGPKRYDYDVQQGKWFYGRDNHTLDELLNKELSDILGKVDVLEGLEDN